MIVSDRPTCRARMKDNLLERLSKMHGEYTLQDPNLIAFCERVQGQEVTLVFTHGDAFEIIDDNYWLPECLWDRIE